MIDKKEDLARISLWSRIKSFFGFSRGSKDKSVDEENHFADDAIIEICKLESRRIEEIKVPAVDIIEVDVSMSVEEVSRLYRDKGGGNVLNYMLVCRHSLDDFVGVLSEASLLSALVTDSKMKIGKVVEETIISMPSMTALDLFVKMRQRGLRTSVIVDEYGGVDGLVSISDIIDELSVSISSARDKQTEPHLRVYDDGRVIADARCRIADVERVIGNLVDDSEREEIGTIGGLIFSTAGRIPTRGEIIPHHSGFEFEIMAVDARSIKKLRIIVPPNKKDFINADNAF